MTRLYLLVSLSFIFSLTSQAQDFIIKGKVVDAYTQDPLEAATIFIESIKDSTLIGYAISEVNGSFELEAKSKLTSFRINYSYNGYKTKSNILQKKAVFNIGTVVLEEQAEALKGVIVSGERIPITIKKDTLEFNADSFKTRPDATVEDVLKKLPGVEVDSDGKITVNGKEVDQVLVNGQVFFSTDPKVATKSLPKDIISKIQITNTKTSTEEFTGDAGDSDNKTINLTIKKDKNKGVMGRLAAGYGTDDRYQANGLLNYFNDKERVSIIASTNNINSSGFSFDEIYDMVGSSGGYSAVRGSGLLNNFGQGIVTSSNIGASYANSEKGKYKLGANYFFAYSDSYNNQKTNRENLLPDQHFFSESVSNFDGSTNSNKGGADLEFDIDKTLRISVKPSMSVNKTNSRRINNERTLDEEKELVNTNNRVTVSNGTQRNFSNRISIMKKLDTVGKYVSLRFSNNNSENNSDANLRSKREIFGDEPEVVLLDQLTDTDTKRDSYEIEAVYRQPLNKKTFLDFSYEYSNEERVNAKEVLDFDEISGAYTNFNKELSSDFFVKNIQQKPATEIRYRGKKLSLSAGAFYVHTKLDNQDFLQETSFSNTYDNFLFKAGVRYTIGKNKRISLRYRSNLDIPSVNELRPVPNVSNPLHIVVGNPSLSPEVNHRISMNYSDYNWKERTGIFFYSGINKRDNQVVRVSETDEDFIKTSTYANVDGNYSGYGGFGYSKQIKKDSTYTMKINFRPSVDFNKEVSFTNNVKLMAKSLSMSPYLSLTFNYKEMLELEPGYRISFNETKYNLDSFEDVKFRSQNVSLKTTSYWPQHLIWGNDLRYSYNGNVGPGFKKDALFWNMSLGLQMLEKKGTFKLTAYDLLDQNINTRRTTGEDFIQDFQGTVLKRYFMASFTYKFDQFGGKKGGRGGRG